MIHQDIKILVVDDDPDVLFATSRIVTSAGYTVMEASTGEAALKTARQNKPDIILLDVVLPDVMGTEICRQIKADAFFDGTFVIMTSGVERTSFKQAQGLDAGADGYIARPISNRECKARINAMVRILLAERKRAFAALKKAHDDLKEKNIALHVLLEKREADKQNIADAMLDNLGRMILPYLDRLKKCNRPEDVAAISSIIETNFQTGLYPLEKRFSSAYKNFTPMEIQVADFIKAGKTSKEIADMLNTSLRSVHFHRNNIRKKLHISRSKSNLRTQLFSLSENDGPRIPGK